MEFQTHIAIVGGGFSGRLVAWHLSQNPSVQVSIFDEAIYKGAGPAYGMASEHHFLNVPAARMGAFPDQPDHFWKWLASQGKACEPTEFVSRKLYGQYLDSILEEAKARGNVNVIAAEVVDINKSTNGYELFVSQRRASISADAVVLACGNHSTLLPSVLNNVKHHGSLVRNPWTFRVSQISSHQNILLVGTGLSSLDVVSALAKVRHKGNITLLSRHGLLPKPHAPFDAVSTDLVSEMIETPTALNYLSTVRRRAKQAKNWRSVIDGLRPHTQKLWALLPIEEQQKFLSRVQSYWNIFRHRAPAVQLNQIEGFMEKGQLSVWAGHLAEATPVNGSQIEIGLTNGEKRTFDWVLNCTGFHSSPNNANHDLWENLLEQGLVCTDEIGIGIKAQGFQVVDGSGDAHDTLFAMGGLIRGGLYEGTAVPELRGQAKALSLEVLERIANKAQSLALA